MAEDKPTQNSEKPPQSIKASDIPGEPEEFEPSEPPHPAPLVCAGRRPLFGH
jgi:hypothetical protein